MKDKYPWLDQGNEMGKYVREILEKYVGLEISCLSDSEKNKSWICYMNIRIHLI